MGRKKGGKNSLGHRAGGARSGAGRPRKTGPLTLKASLRVHAHQPAPDHTSFISRDAIHPALRAFVDLPPTAVLQCCHCGHDDQNALLISFPQESSISPVTTSPLYSRPQSPRSEQIVPPLSINFEHARPGPSPLVTPPQSVSPSAASSADTEHHSSIPHEENVSHAESLLMLSTPIQPSPVPTTHPTYELEPQQLTPVATHPHPSMMQPPHLEQPAMPYDQPCYQDYLPQDNHGAHQGEQYPNHDPQQYRMYSPQHAQPEPHFPTTPTTFQPGPGESSPAQAFYPQPGPQQPQDYSQQQPQTFYAPSPSYPTGPSAEIYLALQQSQHSLLKPGPATWRHAPHSTSLPPAVAAILSPHHTHPQPHSQLDPAGPVQFLPTGQHTQRRRRRCVVCIGAGREGEADRCCGRGNRHLCPWYQRHGSPENIMEIRNSKDPRPTTVT